jgi:hypothetical protein
MCELQEEILKIISPLSSVYSKYQLKSCSLPRALEIFTWYLRYVHIEQAPFTVTPPRHGEAQDWRGDM